MFNSERKEANVPDLHKIVGSTPDGKPVGSPEMSTLTPEQKDALQYYNKLLKLTPGIKEAKRSSLPSTAKYNGDVTKFKEFRNAVEGHYRQQQASYLFNMEFVK